MNLAAPLRVLEGLLGRIYTFQVMGFRADIAILGRRDGYNGFPADGAGST